MKNVKKLLSLLLVAVFICGAFPLAAFSSETYQKGDVDKSGTIDPFDYILLKRAYFGTYTLDNEESVIGDINDDGVNDAFDYILVKRMYFGTYTYNGQSDRYDDQYDDRYNITGMSADELGYVSWDENENADEYMVIVYEGTEIVYAGTNTANHLGILNGQRITVAAMSNGEVVGETAELVYNNPSLNNADLLSLMYAAKDTAETSGDITVYTIAIPKIGTVRIQTENCTFNADGTLKIGVGGGIFSLDELGRLAVLNIEGFGGMVSLRFGYDFKSSSSITDFSEVYCLSEQHSTCFIDCLLFGMTPNYFYFRQNEEDSEYTVTAVDITYLEGTTSIRGASLNTLFCPVFKEGDRYCAEYETRWDPKNFIFDFYLILEPDGIRKEAADEARVYGTYNYTVGNLKDAAGNILDKSTAVIEEGCTLEITVGDMTVDMPLINAEQVNADSYNDLYPDLYPEAIGDINAIVIPVGWNDLESEMNDDTINFISKVLGNVVDINGNVTEYHIDAEGEYTLSEYFYTASYGQLNVNSFITDWYQLDRNFADDMFDSYTIEEYNEINAWLNASYPDLDKSKYDRDGNGIYDAVIMINIGDWRSYTSYSPASFSGAVYMGYYGPDDCTGTVEQPSILNFISINYGHLYDIENDEAYQTAATLVHEFGHVLGLDDYYDVSYSGISALGGYDMQDSNTGDWNVYSKYSVGWITPEVIDEGDFDGESSITVSLESFTKTGDCLIIPASGYDYNGGPFDEYIIVELYTYEGLNAYDACWSSSPLDEAGVRIYHVNSAVVEVLVDGEAQLKHQYNNYYDVLAQTRGCYMIELIQAGGDNTLTDISDENSIRTSWGNDDMFKTGDTFSVNEYTEFFADGLMDNGDEFGYSISIESIEETDGEYTATIVITKD